MSKKDKSTREGKPVDPLTRMRRRQRAEERAAENARLKRRIGETWTPTCTTDEEVFFTSTKGVVQSLPACLARAIAHARPFKGHVEQSADGSRVTIVNHKAETVGDVPTSLFMQLPRLRKDPNLQNPDEE